MNTSPVTNGRLRVIDAMRSHDPLQASTRTSFLQVQEEVLRERSVHDGACIANAPEPAPPSNLRGGASHPQFRAMMLEWATIRREIARQGAAGLVEEQRLRQALQDWDSKVAALRSDPKPSPASRQAVEADFRRALLILDSIERRQLDSLTRAIIRFRHLQRQLGIPHAVAS